LFSGSGSWHDRPHERRRQDAYSVQEAERRGQQGFTLIELLVVVAIIAIIAAIAIPQYEMYRLRAFNAAAESDLRNIKTVLEAYYYDFQSYPQ
jgi:type IV pilus assembly protein PilA